MNQNQYRSKDQLIAQMKSNALSPEQKKAVMLKAQAHAEAGKAKSDELAKIHEAKMAATPYNGITNNLKLGLNIKKDVSGALFFEYHSAAMSAEYQGFFKTIETKITCLFAELVIKECIKCINSILLQYTSDAKIVAGPGMNATVEAIKMAQEAIGQ